MATINEITGDSLTTKRTTDAYRDGWERIFGKKKEQVSNDNPGTDRNQHEGAADDGG
jgi:hypothetical protein